MKLIYQNDEGGISIVTFAPNSKLSPEEQIARSVPAGKSFEWVEESDIPADRSNRDCWVLENKKVKVDSTKLAQKEGKKQEIKDKKDSILAKLGITEQEAKDFKKLF